MIDCKVSKQWNIDIENVNDKLMCGSDSMESLFEEVTLETAQHNLPIVNCDVKGGCGIGCVNC